MDYKELINKPCIIIPFENLQGIITAIFINKKGVEYQVRYYLNGEQKQIIKGFHQYLIKEPSQKTKQYGKLRLVKGEE